MKASPSSNLVQARIAAVSTRRKLALEVRLAIGTHRRPLSRPSPSPPPGGRAVRCGELVALRPGGTVGCDNSRALPTDPTVGAS